MIVKVRGKGGLERHNVYWVWEKRSTHELRAQDQANPQSLDWQEVRKPSLPTKELWKLMASSGGGQLVSLKGVAPVR